jgi:hypothetical protein
MHRLTALDQDELDVVIDAMMARGVLARSGSAVRAGRIAPAVAAAGSVGAPPKKPAARP